MTNILSEIVANKRKEVEKLPKLYRVSKSQKRSFIEAVITNGIIAEIKPKSPSEGRIMSKNSIDKYIHCYDEAAQAISVLCDNKYFGGSYELLERVRKKTRKPILAKEFIIDTRQILQVKKYGADAILLIANILNVKELVSLAKFAVEYGLDILLEVHHKADCDKVFNVFSKLNKEEKDHIIIGINNRNLDSLAISLGTTIRLSKYIRSHLPSVRGTISASSIKTPEQTKRLSGHVDGFLVGTSILRSKDPINFIKSLRQKPKVKFCGITRVEDIKRAENLGVDFLGFIFVTASARSVTLEEAKKLRKFVKKAKVVGVFDDMDTKEINKHIQELDLDFVQLHGKPSLQKVKQIHCPVIQVFKGVPKASTAEKYLQSSKFILIDKAKNCPNGDFKNMAKLPQDLRMKMFIAGGLQPNNVSNVVRMTHPYAVDCASGIEEKHKPGKKSPKQMKIFINKLAQ